MNYVAAETPAQVSAEQAELPLASTRDVAKARTAVEALTALRQDLAARGMTITSAEIPGHA